QLHGHGAGARRAVLGADDEDLRSGGRGCALRGLGRGDRGCQDQRGADCEHTHDDILHTSLSCAALARRARILVVSPRHKQSSVFGDSYWFGSYCASTLWTLVATSTRIA